MKYSVIIPVYNVKDYLERCIDSVLAQDCSDYEIILVNDGSTDGASPEICDRYGAKYPDRIRVIHQPNGGLGDARNTGIDHARGEYLVFLDSDDYLLPEMLNELNQTVQHFACDIVDFGFHVVNESGAVKETHGGELPSNTPLNLKEYPRLLLTLPSAWRRVYRKDLFLKHEIRYPARVWYEDIRTTLKLFAVAESVVSVPKAYYEYVVREGSITRNSNIARNAEILEAFDDLQKWFSARGLWTAYYQEFTKLAVDHILLAASVRVLMIDPRNELLERFQSYMKEQFPDYMECVYLPELSAMHKLALKLIRGKHYSTLQKMFMLKNKLS